MHPKVQRGEMTEEQVFLEFLQNFKDANKDGKISRDVYILFFYLILLIYRNGMTIIQRLAHH